MKTGHFLGVLIPVGMAFLLGIGPAIRLIGLAVLLTLAMIIYYRLKIGIITGDMMGAMIEITECGLFLLISIDGRIE